MIDVLIDCLLDSWSDKYVSKWQKFKCWWILRLFSRGFFLSLNLCMLVVGNFIKKSFKLVQQSLQQNYYRIFFPLQIKNLLTFILKMSVAGVSRGVFLLWDAYNEAGSLYAPIAYILLNIGYPCITSSFAILFLALLRVTQVFFGI